jgi:hypothetical protein
MLKKPIGQILLPQHDQRIGVIRNRDGNRFSSECLAISARAVEASEPD